MVSSHPCYPCHPWLKSHSLRSLCLCGCFGQYPASSLCSLCLCGELPFCELWGHRIGDWRLEISDFRFAAHGWDAKRIEVPRVFASLRLCVKIPVPGCFMGSSHPCYPCYPRLKIPSLRSSCLCGKLLYFPASSLCPLCLCGELPFCELWGHGIGDWRLEISDFRFAAHGWGAKRIEVPRVFAPLRLCVKIPVPGCFMGSSHPCYPCYPRLKIPSLRSSCLCGEIPLGLRLRG